MKELLLPVAIMALSFFPIVSSTKAIWVLKAGNLTVKICNRKSLRIYCIKHVLSIIHHTKYKLDEEKKIEDRKKPQDENTMACPIP